MQRTLLDFLAIKPIISAVITDARAASRDGKQTTMVSYKIKTRIPERYQVWYYYDESAEKLNEKYTQESLVDTTETR